jgi:hypothetical protein
VKRVLEGESLRSLAKELNSRGIKTSVAGKKRKLGGKDEFYVVKGEWRSVTLSQVLRSPTLAGIRVHNGDVHSEDTGEPILSKDEHRALLRILASRRSDQTAEDRSHLLSGAGVIRCGLCKQPMRRMSFRMSNGRMVVGLDRGGSAARRFPIVGVGAEGSVPVRLCPPYWSPVSLASLTLPHRARWGAGRFARWYPA